MLDRTHRANDSHEGRLRGHNRRSRIEGTSGRFELSLVANVGPHRDGRVRLKLISCHPSLLSRCYPRSLVQMERPDTYGLWDDRPWYYDSEDSLSDCSIYSRDHWPGQCEWCMMAETRLRYWSIPDGQWQVPRGLGLCHPCMLHWLEWRACPFRPRRQDRQLAHLHCAFWHKEIGAHPNILNRIALFCWSNQVA